MLENSYRIHFNDFIPFKMDSCFSSFCIKTKTKKYPQKPKTKLFDVAFIVVIHDYGVLSDLFRVICITEMFLKFSMSCGKRAFSDLMFYETCFRLILNGL